MLKARLEKGDWVAWPTHPGYFGRVDKVGVFGEDDYSIWLWADYEATPGTYWKHSSLVAGGARMAIPEEIAHGEAAAEVNNIAEAL